MGAHRASDRGRRWSGGPLPMAAASAWETGYTGRLESVLFLRGWAVPMVLYDHCGGRSGPRETYCRGDGPAGGPQGVGGVSGGRVGAGAWGGGPRVATG